MRRLVAFLAPLLITALIFFSILFFLDKKPGKGALQVKSVPKSQVYLDNKLIGTTDFCACDVEHMLNVGDYTIRLVPLDENFKPFEQKITIYRGTLTAIDRAFVDNVSSEGSIVSLISIDDKKDAQILIVSLPDKASVFLDSNPVGFTPLLLKQISESDHDLRITRDGYKDKSIPIKTALGYELNALIFLGVKSDLTASSSASVPTATPSAVAVTNVLILNTPTGFLRVRESNSLASNEITQVKPGESYELIEEKDNWFKIRLKDGESGWISSSYAAKE